MSISFLPSDDTSKKRGRELKQGLRVDAGIFLVQKEKIIKLLASEVDVDIYSEGIDDREKLKRGIKKIKKGKLKVCVELI